MRKDYTPVADDLVKRDETRFVSDFWSERWQGQSISKELVESVMRREEYRIMNPYLRELGAKAKILDGGCGLGEWTVLLSSQQFSVHGLDISAPTIERLKKHFPNEQFMVGDIRQTGFHDGFFDAYFSWGAFEHFEEGLGRCFEEARRILRQGGYLFVTVPFHNTRHWKEDNRAYRRSMHGSQDSPGSGKKAMRFYQWRLTRLELKQEFEMHGFGLISISPIDKEEGLSRFAKHAFGAQPGTRIHHILKMLLGLLVTRNFVSHMLMGVGRKL